jgi:phospholipase C
MFQTNQGPSFPAHQFIFGGTSAPSAEDDAIGTFAAENGGSLQLGGCAAPPGRTVQLIDSAGVENPDNKIFPCFEHNTVPDLLLPGGVTWRYYTPGQNSIWSAPNAINHICEAQNEKCTGSMWTHNVDLRPADVLRDISHCRLRNASWVIPTGQNSDHPQLNKGGGPSWVASIVNAIGTSACKDGNRSYWDDTAIVILWDDWGGFYDHEPPTFLQAPEGGYQLGYRVPMIVVSAYTPAGYIDNTRHDFGSIIRFIEQNFQIAEGSLDFADARASTDLLNFFNFGQSPRAYHMIPAKYDANYFLNDKSAPLPPDDD